MIGINYPIGIPSMGQFLFKVLKIKILKLFENIEEMENFFEAYPIKKKFSLLKIENNKLKLKKVKYFTLNSPTQIF